ncbi:TonB-dependent receptor [Helicobacter turcicus]|uniref:TonB-dependent receptor n=1 Tax=Helicobacter turcicus TaxID=2867412 RepID=A0ABS7JM16_9HELI|nr:TonB-dependent receptor [Helicobacter turcicus]MBX7490439.1 TonB-dependent receptor [Helicobacter turcicus]MBX7545299.1 TonB-dependent receptor [Helicobacter turcicus]
MKKTTKNLYPKGFRKKYFSLAAILALNASLLAQSQNTAMLEKSDSANKNLKLSVIHAEEFVENADFKEEFDAQSIALSNAQNIYDFLNANSLLTIRSNYGNPYTQNIDLRGFGQNGHKNLAIIVDGIRLDNVDSAPISLSGIPLDSIQKIEIIRGKGTTKYGNGAVSGILKITTTRKSGGALDLSYASYDTLNSQFFARTVRDTLNIGVYGQYQHTQGDRYLSNLSDEKSGSYNKNGGITAFLYPSNDLLLKANLNYAKYAIKYANPIPKETFENNPKLPGNGHTHQNRWDLTYSTGFTSFSDSGITTDVNIGGSRNTSRYINFDSKYEGKGLFGDFNAQFKNDSFMAEIGGELRTNERQNSGQKAEVNTMLIYGNGEKYLGDSTLNAGISTQRIITKQSGTYSEQDNLLGGELGYQYALNRQISLYASYARSFNVPNVDWMLYYNPISFTPIANPYIDVATFDTYQIGAKGIFGIHTINGNVFVIQGKDEAFYGFNKLTGVTTNQSLGKTQRIGGELQFTTQFSTSFYSSLSYAYVDAEIRSNEYRGKEIPGVSKHTFTTSLNYLPLTNLNLGVHYKFGSKMHDYNDFDNTKNKAPNYQSLNLNASYTFKNFEVYAYVNNLTNHKNAIVVSGAYYPYEFERTFGGGVKYTW